MPMKFNENGHSYYIYRNLTYLTILLHFGYTLLMGIPRYGVPLLYSICSILFYIGMLPLVMKRKRYALAISLIHSEVICSVVLRTVLFGWNASFFLFLIAMTSLVYFCPYCSPYIPHLFSILHMFTFSLLHEQIQGTIFSSLSAASLQPLFLHNNFGSLLATLCIAYISSASADIGKEILKKQDESLLQIANYDSLTGLCNHTYLKKTASQLCLGNCYLTIDDTDDSERTNDTCDHLCGDAILKQLAEHIRTRLDPVIFICCWSSEEFAFLFHDTREQGALQQLQDFCYRMSHTEFQYGEQDIPVTMTFGICRHQRLPPDELISKADQLLYQGK